MGTYNVVARNFSAATENKIHSDDVARKYGFKGALVPGAAVYGHLTHPLVERFGEAWLASSVSSVRFLKPAYDGDALVVTMTADGAGNHVQCHNGEGTLLAELHSQMPPLLPEPESQEPLEAPPRPRKRVEISWESVQEGRPFERWHWQITEDDNRRYAEQIADELPVYRHCAHPHWLLGVANTALTREYVMPAWIHVGSEIRFRELLKVHDTVEVRAVPVEKWRRKGHEFVRLYLAYYRDKTLTTEIFHNAIFRVAG